MRPVRHERRWDPKRASSSARRRHPVTCRVARPARWSPDGQSHRLSAVDSREVRARLYAMHADGTGFRPLADEDGVWVQNDPTWSPDGTQIAFNRWQRDDAGDWHVRAIAIAALDGGIRSIGVVPASDGCAHRVVARRQVHPVAAGYPDSRPSPGRQRHPEPSPGRPSSTSADGQLDDSCRLERSDVDLELAAAGALKEPAPTAPFAGQERTPGGRARGSRCMRLGCGERIRTSDLRVMSPTSCRCSTPRPVTLGPKHDSVKRSVDAEASR